MKTKWAILPLIAIIIAFAACDDDDDKIEKEKQKNYEHVNKWVYANMDFYYYWRDKMPAARVMDYKADPKSFFGKLLFNKANASNGEDRFSWIQENYVDLLNSLSGVSQKEIGFHYGIIEDEKEKAQGLFVLYIKKGTKAEKSGLKRGDVITKVNGVQINDENYRDIFSQNVNSYQLEGINFPNKITVETTDRYAENPIYLDSIYSIKGKDIGYIVYNQFTMDKGDGSYSYDKQLAEIFSKFNSKGIRNLILDLRYNNGGYVTCAVNMASALVPNRDTSEKFCYKDFNPVFDAEAKKEFGDKYDSFINDYFKDNIEAQKENGLIVNMGAIPHYGDNIDKLYILVGGSTASASELIINGLAPFMKEKIVLIGSKTAGKNVGSFSLYDEDDDKNKWGIQPIVSRSYNKLGESEYGSGFTPGVQFNGEIIDDFAGIFDQGLKPLGDKDENLLGYALADIAGTSKSAIMIRKSTTNINRIGSSLDFKPGAYQMFINDVRMKKLIRKVD